MVKRKRKKKNRHTGLKLLVLGGLILATVACFHKMSGGKELAQQAQKVVEQTQEVAKQARKAVEEAKEEVELIKESLKEANLTTQPATYDKENEEKWEMPAKRMEDTRILERMAYTLSYNDEWRIPNWVAWELTPEEVKGKAKRTDFFETDFDLPKRARSEYHDYRGSDYDRGHMAPAGDMKWDEEAMKESFYMSNICPQAPQLNRGDWRILEENCREWAKQHRTPIYIVCGPIVDEDKTHKRIGKNKVTVPDAFFKVVMKLGRRPSAVGFIFPNDDCNESLESYAMPVDSVESVTGIDFFHLLPDDQENELEAKNGFKLF